MGREAKMKMAELLPLKVYPFIRTFKLYLWDTVVLCLQIQMIIYETKLTCNRKYKSTKMSLYHVKISSDLLINDTSTSLYVVIVLM